MLDKVSCMCLSDCVVQLCFSLPVFCLVVLLLRVGYWHLQLLLQNYFCLQLCQIFFIYFGGCNCESESEVAQSCLTLCNPMDCSLPGAFIHGIFQAKILEWVATSFSRRSSWPKDWTQVSRIVGTCFTVWATISSCCTETFKMHNAPLCFFFDLKFVLTDISLINPALLWLLFPCNNFFHPFTFSLFVSLKLRWVSWRGYIIRSWFCMYLPSLFLIRV